MTAHRYAKIAQSRTRPLWLAFVLICALLTLGSDGQMLRWLIFDPSSVGTLGVRFERDATGAPGTLNARELAPDSTLRAAGVREGDRLRLDNRWDDLLMPRSGEPFGFVDLTRDPGHRRTVVVPVAPPLSAMDTFLQALTPVANIIAMLIGLLIVWRSRGELNAMRLGTAFVLIGPMPPYFWPLPSSHAPVWDLATMSVIALIPWVFVRFAMGYYAHHTGRVRRWETVAFWVLVAAQAATSGVEMVDTLWDLRLPNMGVIRPLSYYLNAAGLCIPAWYLVNGWLKSGPEFRTRYAMMLVALPISLLSQAIYVLTVASEGTAFDFRSPAIIAAALGLIVGPVVFAYAVLRHKVLDLGFALNRVLVYGVVSAVLLGAFGLLEWAAEHFVPIQGREKNALIDAAIALGVFLAFHRVRDAVEHGVETLLFRRWRENETALRRFVQEAAFVTKPAGLRGAFVGELTRFCGGAACALYWRDGRARYRLADGATGFPSRIDPDDPALVALRSRRRAVELDDTTSAIDAALALPMAHRHDLEGFALIARKPDGDRYRPDEIEALTQAAWQVGLDLHALEMERLQHESAELKRSNATLAAQLEVAREMGR